MDTSSQQEVNRKHTLWGVASIITGVIAWGWLVAIVGTLLIPLRYRDRIGHILTDESVMVVLLIVLPIIGVILGIIELRKKQYPKRTFGWGIWLNISWLLLPIGLYALKVLNGLGCDTSFPYGNPF